MAWTKNALDVAFMHVASTDGDNTFCSSADSPRHWGADANVASAPFSIGTPQHRGKYTAVNKAGSSKCFDLPK